MIENTKTHARFGLTGNQLKILAMVCMCIGHIGLQFAPTLMPPLALGCQAFPIFAYMIAEGCRYTRDRKRHLLLLGGLAVACQLVFLFATASLYMSILMTFTLSVLIIYTLDALLKEQRVLRAIPFAIALACELFVVIGLPLLLAPWGFYIDYGIIGVAAPVLLYYIPNKWWKLSCLAVLLLLHALQDGSYTWFAFLALILLALYNGTRGKYKLKYLFYIFYPVHLGLIYLVALLLQTPSLF